MHYLIRLIVPGDNAEEAMDEAKDFADQLCDPEYGGDFDWNDLDGRWGKSKAHKLSTKSGREQVDDALKSNRESFDSAMAHVRYMLEHYSDDEIFNSDFGTREEQEKVRENNDKIYNLTRWQFARIGSSGKTNDCYLYAKDWVTVENNNMFEAFILNEKLNKLWVVPVDFHN